MTFKNQLKIENLNFSRNKQFVLNQINLDVPSGAITVLLGPNGSGKSTILKIIAGILNWNEGNIYYQGKNLKNQTKKFRCQNICYLPQQNDFELSFSVSEYVALGRYPHKGFLPILNSKDEQIINESLQMANLTALAQRHISELSGGEQQRALIARALATQADLLILDEPTSGLDIHHSLELYRLLNELKQKSKSIFIALHNIQDAFSIADQIVLINQGKTIYNGSRDDPQLINKLEDVFEIKAIRKESLCFELP